jgi:hypothetical protein
MIGETKYQATARLDADGEVRVSVTGVTPYGKRSAGATADITDKKIKSEIGKLLKQAIKGVQADVQPESFKAAAEAMVIAANRKEDI